MSLYDRHVFVCVNDRPPSDPRPCCASRGGRQVRDRLKAMVVGAGLEQKVRINAALCLDQCSRGAAIVVYPEGVWYVDVTEQDVDEIFREHILGGRPVERLSLPGTSGG